MNLEDAFSLHHVKPSTYTNNIQVDPTCVFCGCKQSISLLRNMDNGVFRQCGKCRKQFNARIMTAPLMGYLQATSHLQGTN